jgi:tetraacyldisaccharide 4'-kinase
MFSNVFLRSFRILLLPVALLYWLAIAIRNWCYDKNIFKTTSFGLPVICIGNVSVGGTGKSPLVEYLMVSLKEKYRIAILSRGYKRRTRGYSLANEHTTALDIGDEPMQFHRKFPEVPVAVGEERIVAIPQLLHDRPATQAIILDDAFQHRALTAGLNILLTDSNNLFTRDFYLPTGDLRDLKSSYQRAHIIVVTKCRMDMTTGEAADIVKEIHPGTHQHVFFSAIQYDEAYHIINQTVRSLGRETEVLLVAGIANPAPLKSRLEETSKAYYMIHFPDHHIFTIDDLKDLKKKFEKIETDDKIILTTEKDAVRLFKFREEINHLPFYVLPIRHRFLFNGENSFDGIVNNFIENFKREEQL